MVVRDKLHQFVGQMLSDPGGADGGRSGPDRTSSHPFPAGDPASRQPTVLATRRLFWRTDGFCAIASWRKLI